MTDYQSNHLKRNATFTDGALAPLEPLRLAEDEIVSITIDTGKEFEGWKGPDWTATTKAEVPEAETTTEELIRFIYRSRRRGFDCDCIYCAPKASTDE